MAQQKLLGFWSIVALVIGTQLGSGIMAVPGKLSPYGVWGIVSWLVTGSGIIVLAMVFAVLAAHFPKTGGPHAYVYAAFGRKAAFYTAWSYWALSWISSIPLIVLATSSLEMVMGPWNHGQRLFAEFVILSSVMLINVTSMNVARICEFVLSFLRAVPLFVIPFIGFFYWDSANIIVPTDMTPLEALNSASLLTLWGFVGFEAGTTPAGEVKDARRAIPRGLFFGTLIVTIIYVLNMASMMGVLSPQELSTSASPYADFLQKMLGGYWGKITALFITFICVGALNSWAIASGQISLGAAEEKLFPRIFAKKNKYHSPTVGISVIAALLAVCLLFLQSQSLGKQLEIVIEFSCSAYVFIYLICVITAIWLTVKRKIESSIYIWVLCGIGAIFCLWSTFTLIRSNIYYLLGMILVPASGFVVAKLFRWPINEVESK